MSSTNSDEFDQVKLREHIPTFQDPVFVYTQYKIFRASFDLHLFLVSSNVCFVSKSGAAAPHSSLHLYSGEFPLLLQ